MGKNKIIFTGGGSGGHTMPALALITELLNYASENNVFFDILYIGSNKGIEKRIAHSNGINFKNISTGKLRRYISLQNFFDIFKIILGIIQSLFIILKFKPDVVFSTGGFVSVPVVLAAKILRKKIIIHEQTVDAGLANKICGRVADVVALTFKESQKYFKKEKCVVTGIPLRNQIFSGDKNSALKLFGVDPDLPVIYFTGGGLGCHLLNVVSLEIMNDLLQRFNIIFQTGNSDNGEDFNKLTDFKNQIADEKIKRRLSVFNFIGDELKDVFAVADLCVARSGAGTVCELIALRIPAVFIPLAIATNNEQYKNAMIMKNMNSCIIIEEKQLNKTILLETLTDLFQTGQIKDMKRNLENIENFVGNKNVLELILQCFKTGTDKERSQG